MYAGVTLWPKAKFLTVWAIKIYTMDKYKVLIIVYNFQLTIYSID